jgi:eukaryotic-like serine/threonine-protein kinase
MSLPAGARLAAYEILTLIGSGGMGEVYRARDTKLNRDVAIKILPSEFALDPERLARFKREAQVLASLNHPNIAQIYGFEESAGILALVLEFVEGSTLADRLTQGPIAIDEALPIAKQIADALEAAHEQGIIHRDLKPANVAIREDGTVKVLDFGLAKGLEPPAASNPTVTASPTITTPAMTELGVILGTAAYMAPEQAKGRSADKRSDVWAFGCVLYEMLAGTPAFGGDDVTDVIAAVVRGEPDWSALPPDVPEGIRLLLRRSLLKDRKSRVADISTARFVITEPLASGRPPASAIPPLGPRRPVWRRIAPFAVTAVVASAASGAVVWLTKPPAALAPVARFSMPLAPGQVFTNPGRRVTAISPDGRQFVYVSNQQVYLRELASTEARAIPGSMGGVGGVSSPTFSPDGRSLVFYSSGDRALKRIAITGGVAATVCPAENPFGISWTEGGIVFGQGAKGIFRVSPNGGTPEVLVSVERDEYADAPQILPGGKVLFTVTKGSARDRWEHAQIVVTEPKAHDRKVVIENGASGQYVSTGHILYARGGVLYASGFDPIRLEASGTSIPVLEGVRRATSIIGQSATGGSAPQLTGEAQFSISSTGTLVYVPGPTAAASEAQDLALVDRNGTIERLKLPAGPYFHARMSPDGRRVAFTSETTNDGDVFVYAFGGGTTMQRLTFGGVNRFPVWSGDGKRIAFQSDRSGDRGIFWQPADGAGTAERLTKAEEGTAHTPESWSPSGNELLYTITTSSKVTLWVLSMAQRRSSRFPDVESRSPIGAAFSSDGRWVAYGASGGVFVQPYPPTGAKYQVPSTTSSAHHPFWSRDGKELFYEPGINQLFVVPVRTHPEFAFGTPISLPAGNFGSTNPAFARNRDIDLTGKRFITPALANQADYGSAFMELRVVLNWFQELKERVPTK